MVYSHIVASKRETVNIYFILLFLYDKLKRLLCLTVGIVNLATNSSLCKYLYQAWEEFVVIGIYCNLNSFFHLVYSTLHSSIDVLGVYVTTLEPLYLSIYSSQIILPLLHSSTNIL